jgi:hypothetical protein
MGIPTTRTEFRDYCLRRLGWPVVKHHLEETQIEDRIDDALQYFWEYHFEGSERVYYKYQVTQEDRDNKYITLPENIIGAVHMFPISSAVNMANMFDVRYQIALNDLYTLTSVAMAPYVMAMQHLQFIEQILIGQQPIRYNRHVNKLYIDMDWNRIDVGMYLVVEAYSVVDPTTYPDVWKDRWLARYATCLMKQQQGTNLKKYGKMEMPSGISFNGQQIYDEATLERQELEKEMINSFSLPTMDFMG